jgi:hypothetical protein
MDHIGANLMQKVFQMVGEWGGLFDYCAGFGKMAVVAFQAHFREIACPSLLAIN